ncbi:MAG: YheU family protein [Steroidobacteraceae bacterium]
MTEPVLVPHGELSAQALQGVIESFVLREGTDYGERELSLEQKVAQVRDQLEHGQARILFDQESNTVTLEVVP